MKRIYPSILPLYRYFIIKHLIQIFFTLLSQYHKMPLKACICNIQAVYIINNFQSNIPMSTQCIIISLKIHNILKSVQHNI